ncbi:THAP domain-containing protein 11 [Monodelphis domestica]|uniref:THAP domain-containing protein 11 n=1 Tax=Monodelphis domestica TaxID=13616 RepID=F7G587_MONDO|nr:THAP domain-containing protein 11 [Monodelphis domestica]
MPGFTCCVPGCYNNSHRDKALHFYTFPKDAELRRLWLKNVSRAGVSGCFSTFQPTAGHRLCSVHFQGGRKTYTVRVPTIFPLRGVNERKARRPGAGGAAGAAARRRQQQLQLQQQQNPQQPQPTALPAPSQASLVSASAAVLLTLQAAVDSGPTAAATPPQPPSGEDVKPIDLTVQVEFASAEGASAPELGVPAAVPAVTSGPRLVVVGEGFPDTGSDHSYSLSSGTTEEELLRKLNEQRDILALMEVKMKEMKGSIRHLRLTEAKLREELREKDRLLAMAVIRKKHGM